MPGPVAGLFFDMMKPPIIVAGAARSGTSLTMRILYRCGMQVGARAETQTAPGAPWGEGRIRDEFYKPVLSAGGFDPLAQTSLPPIGWEPDMTPEEMRDRILELSEIDDPTKPWGFKAVKGMLFWRALEKAFPGAHWVAVKREPYEHAHSLMRTPFMTAYTTVDGWLDYLNDVDAHLMDLICESDNVDVFAPKWVREGETDKVRRMVEECGLRWEPGCMSEFNPNLYRK